MTTNETVAYGPSSEAIRDPDPTTQTPWPSSRKADEPLSPVEYRAPLPPVGARGGASQNASQSNNSKKDKREPSNEEIGTRRLSNFNLFNLSISMAGAQIVWTVELGYGTPFLLSLGLSEQLTSLVWLAGPISGLIAQPLIGAISDSSNSRYRRRFWIITSTAILCISTLLLAYCKELATFFVDLFHGGLGDWDPERKKQVANTAIGFAVVAFYLLDFTLNALQASLRNLLLDVTPPAQLNSGNAWHGRMIHAGNIVGYGFGFLPLATLPVLNLLGGTQFRKFCVVAMSILVVTIAITCTSQDERVRKEDFKDRNQSKLVDVLRNIRDAVINLPRPIRRVCYVQIFAFMGWFPFLFYATTYVGEVMAKETGEEPDAEVATRMGNLALLSYSIVAVIAGTLLPQLANRDRRLLEHEGDDEEDAELVRLRNTVREWRAEAALKGKPMKLPTMPFMLRNIWTGALVLFSLLMLSTFFINTVAQAIICVSLVGICWAVACWVPFAIIMEFLKEMGGSDKRQDPVVHSSAVGPYPRHHFRATSSPSVVMWRNHTNDQFERQPLLRRRSLTPNYFDNDDELADAQPLAGGTVLGIHNLAIVIPQFLVAVVASTIFQIVDEAEDPNNHNTYLGKNGVAWVLRFGGLCTLGGALIARMVPPTKTEKEMRRRLSEMEILKEQTSP